MRLLPIIEYSTVVIGIIAVIASRYFALPAGFHLGLSLIGAGIALAGLESVLTGRMSFRLSGGTSKDYVGPPATIFGLMALLIGATLIGCAYLLTAGIWDSTLNHLSRRPGLALIGAGLLAVGAGLLMMINTLWHSGPAWKLVVRALWSLLGFILIVAGLPIIGLGIWELLDPLAFDRFVSDLQKRLDLRAFERWWERLSGLRR
jgi:hypothetical protein